ncbi:man(5)GlcNAc(2)-PP-dolichol translocation protein RFT1-like [Babylonia areolata]|uniref:man(5)GlcNAc(2)-PP-dolichol translocation protein RFT1-like n=1 Tax=Babylonia areolata TaxID=304850 RepID=UPI003FD433E0
MEASTILASTARATGYNMVLQVTIRLMTFVSNAVVLRYISRDLLGVLNVRLTLLYSTILFLTKEAFERACLSRRDGQDWRRVINLIWCTAPLGVVISVALSAVWLYLLERPEAGVVGDYGVGVVAFAVSGWVEVLAEPLYVTGQAFFFIRLKVLALGMSQAVKCVVSLVLVLTFPDWGVYSFSLAQVLSSVSYVALYYGYFAHYTASRLKKEDDHSAFPCVSMADFLPRVVPGESFFDAHLVHLTWSFFKQSLLKQLLTEGERYVMTFLNVLSFADQGVYDVINNLGSMVARFIFLPIEENGYIFFSQSLSRGKPAKEQAEQSVAFSGRVLNILLKIVTFIGCTVIVFGYANSYLALLIYGGDRLSVGSGPTLLRWYCVYVLLLAVNGITEGFVFATMSKDQVDRYNRKMLGFSVLFLTTAWVLTLNVGSVGFILANCLNMAMRITHSLLFIRRYFEGTESRPLSGVLPSTAVTASLGVSLMVTALSEHHLVTQGGVVNNVTHIAVSAVCLTVVLVAVFLTERPMLQSARSLLTQHRATHREHQH